MVPLRVVVAGGGWIGERTARLLDDRGHDVVERDPNVAAAPSDEYAATVAKGMRRRRVPG